jgi:hypothetical protein
MGTVFTILLVLVKQRARSFYCAIYLPGKPIQIHGSLL